MSEDAEEKNYKFLYILFVVVIVLWTLFEFVPYKLFSTWTDRGTFGDSFGAINSLFSGLAFAGIIYTIILQKNELQLQRQELAFTRKELERSALAQEESEKSLKEQSRLMEEQAKLMREQIEFMEKQNIAAKEAAKLEAISTVVSYYSQSAASSKNDNWNWSVQATQKASKYVEILEKQIEQMNKIADE